ncbi:glycosyltransferase family 2 protein [Clostridium sp.]|uniref:glycosyltransferase family 2 protein n=1 Tax=Clostridium sp. TaxID=1506 RepID=UPI003D6CDE11
MNKPKISIITPSFNQGHFIENAINSVLDQKYNNIEHIIVDGGSSDDTISILKKYPHLKWISEPDKGQSDALNKALAMATGDIIGWLNTDDYYSNGIFDIISDSFNNNDIDILYGDNYFVNSEKKLLGTKKSNSYNKNLTYFYCYIPSTSFFMRRNIIDQGVRFDIDFDVCMDKEFFAHLANLNKKFKYISMIMAYFTIHENNKSNLSPEVKDKNLKESIIIINRYYKKEIRIISDKYFYKICFFYNLLKRRLILAKDYLLINK